MARSNSVSSVSSSTSENSRDVPHPSFVYTDGSDLSDNGENTDVGGVAIPKRDPNNAARQLGESGAGAAKNGQGLNTTVSSERNLREDERNDGGNGGRQAQFANDAEYGEDGDSDDWEDEDQEDGGEEDEDEDDGDDDSEEEDDDEDEDEDDEDDDEEEEEDVDDDNEDLKSNPSDDQSIRLSTRHTEELEAWIQYSEDPVPSLEAVQNKAKEMFNHDLSLWDEQELAVKLEDRLRQGPPITKDRLLCPGFGLPIAYLFTDPDERFPFLLGIEDHDWSAVTLTNREICMLKFIQDITDKPNWWKKVRDPRIAKKWKTEVLAMPWTEYRKYGEFTEQMADVCIEELLRKADLYEETSIIPVLDYDACVIKSDSLMTAEMVSALRAAVAPLENIPEDEKDWHPGSDGKVLDLVHPSWCPLVYGLSRVIPDKRIPLDTCLDYCGVGTIIPVPERPEIIDAQYNVDDTESANGSSHPISLRFQWLPCDVNLTGEQPRIDSYINNLHPMEHKQLYSVIEDFIKKSLPAFDLVWRWPEEFGTQRIAAYEIEHECHVPDICGEYCSELNRPVTHENHEGNGSAEEVELNQRWFSDNHTQIIPDAQTSMEEVVQVNADEVQSSGFFDKAPRAQFIVKLANIHLTPDKPKYNGGSWHIEGQYNEHICATALFYYDNDNITDSYLDFRTQANSDELVDDLDYDQGEFLPVEKLFDIDTSGNTMQNIGSVLTREGRALFFPNVYQHHVSPFELADKTRPGHRKILALFLVDPAVTVLSTANVPPQQQQWWLDDVAGATALSKLPPELMEEVKMRVDFPISQAAAKDIREKLMQERSRTQHETNTSLKHSEWNFCEH